MEKEKWIHYFKNINLFLSKISNQELSKDKGLFLFILLFCHYFFVTFIVIYLLLGDVDILYYFNTIIILFLAKVNLDCHGCPVIMIEKKYINDSWKGIWHLFGSNIETKSIVKYLYVYSILLFLTILYRVLFLPSLKIVKQKNFYIINTIISYILISSPLFL
tara:strand:+ start:56 stop:541 length:486 start_codon:yes stop_codon:yes gene_type:complete